MSAVWISTSCLLGRAGYSIVQLVWWDNDWFVLEVHVHGSYVHEELGCKINCSTIMYELLLSHPDVAEYYYLNKVSVLGRYTIEPIPCIVSCRKAKH
jgi:hypothetical protein